MPTKADRCALALLLILFSLPAAAADLLVTVTRRDARALSGAVIMLESRAPGGQPAPPLQAAMDQVDLAFAPDVLVIPVHSTVQFPNSDRVSHQVYSFSSARSFQLPLYRGKPYPPVQFDRPGVVTLGCNIHDNMLAYIVVTGARHFGRTDASGQWRTTDLPAGPYLLRLWHPLLDEGKEVTRELSIGEADTTVDLQLTRKLRPAPITGQPHSWDY